MIEGEVESPKFLARARERVNECVRESATLSLSLSLSLVPEGPPSRSGDVTAYI